MQGGQPGPRPAECILTYLSDILQETIDLVRRDPAACRRDQLSVASHFLISPDLTTQKSANGPG